MSRTVDFGFLDKGEIQTSNAFMLASGTQTDVYKFSTGTARVAVSASTFGFSSGDRSFIVSLFQDTGNGTFENSDRLITSSNQNRGTNEPRESITTVLSQGTYFFVASIRFPTETISYFCEIGRAGGPGQANLLANEEFKVGEISKDLRKRSRISDINTADNYAFTLNSSSRLNVNVRELRNTDGDVNIRIVRDLNANRVVDKGEVVVKGTSSSRGNVDTVTGLTGAGDYILQVCQSQGNSVVGVTFDHSAL